VLQIHATITGALNIEVPDADAFLIDHVAQSAVTEAIAEELGVNSSYITLVVTKANRRLASDRRLASTAVNIDYRVDIPKSASSSWTSTVANLNAMTTSNLQSAVASKITATKGSDYTVTILSSTQPVIILPETTTLAGESSTQLAIILLETTTVASESSIDAVPRNAICSFWVGIALIALACI
jgi:hypothetical protein